MLHRKILTLMLLFFVFTAMLNAENIENININIIEYKKNNKIVTNINNLVLNTKLNILNLGNFDFQPITKHNIKIENNYPFFKVTLLSITDLEWKYIKHSTELPVGTKFEDKNILKIPYGQLLLDYYNNIQTIVNLKDTIISKNNPKNTKVIWYKPDGNGNFDIFMYLNKKWTGIGTYYLSKDIKLNYIFNSLDEINNIEFPLGTKIYVKLNNSVVEYTYTTEGLKAKETSKDKYNGFTTLKDLLTVNYNKQGGSKALIKGNGNYLPINTSYYTFIKYDDYVSGGYWKTTDGHYWIYDNMDNLYNNTLLNGLNNGDIVFTIDKSFNIYKLVKLDNIFAYIAENLPGVLFYKDAPAINGNVYVYDTNDKYLFLLKDNKYFIPINIDILPRNPYYLTWKGREYFPTPSIENNTNIYLTEKNDCTPSTCFGNSSTDYYAGIKTQSLYTFYPADIEHSLNNLADAQPFDNWQNLYDSSSPVTIYTGNSFNDVKSYHIYIKDVYNFSDIYKEEISGKYLNRNQGYYIPQNYLGIGYTGVNVNISKLADETYYINLKNDEDIFNFSKAHNGYQVKGNNIGLVKKCNNFANEYTYWSDNCNKVQNANIVIGMGSRTQLPSPNISTRINLTKKLGNEPRHTSDGIKWTKNNKFYQWFYTITNDKEVVNNMTDVYCAKGYDLILNNYTCKKFIGWQTLESVSANVAPGGGYSVKITLKLPVKIDWVAFSEDTRLTVAKCVSGSWTTIAYWRGKHWEGNCGVPVLNGCLLGYCDDGCTGGETVDYFGSKNISLNTDDVFFLSVHEGGSCSSDKLGYKILLKPIEGINYNSSPVKSLKINDKDASYKLNRAYDIRCPLGWKWNNSKTACIPK